MRRKRQSICAVCFRAANQNAIPIVNYNDPVSKEETRRFEIASLRQSKEGGSVVECVDNDETAVVVSRLVGAERLVILTSTQGIYRDPNDPSTLIEEVRGSCAEEIDAKIDEMIAYCNGASALAPMARRPSCSMQSVRWRMALRSSLPALRTASQILWKEKSACTRLMVTH